MELRLSELKDLLEWAYEQGKERVKDDIELVKNTTLAQPQRAVPKVTVDRSVQDKEGPF